MAAKALQFHGMLAFIHAGGQSAALKAVSTKIPAAKTCCARARFDDLRNCPWGNREGADLGQGRGLARPRLLWQPDSPEHGA